MGTKELNFNHPKNKFIASFADKEISERFPEFTQEKQAKDFRKVKRLKKRGKIL